MNTSQALPNVIGCDIGGANLKLADCFGSCASRVFPMWLQADQLGSTLRDMLGKFPVTETTYLAVTITAELADCFATRREGVQQILLQLEHAFDPLKTLVYAVGNRWLTSAEAVAAPWDVAASNWHALATWIGIRDAERVDLVLDIGSTTVDIIPMLFDVQGFSRPATPARTDRDRLEFGQLVYTGLERTPIAAIVRAVIVQGRTCPVMAEHFATSDDCYIVVGLTPEWPGDCDTADSRPRTRANAHARLARMIGEDAETLPIEASQQIAQQVINAQADQVAEAIERNLSKASRNITAAGHGRALAQLAIAKLTQPAPTVTWLADQLSPAAARCAPALAVAHLLASHLLRAQNDWGNRSALNPKILNGINPQPFPQFGPD